MDIREFPVYGYDDSNNLIASKMTIKIYDKRLSPRRISSDEDRIAKELMDGLSKQLELEPLLIKLIYNKDIKPILTFLQKDNWRYFSNLYMKTRFSNPVNYQLKDLKKFDLSVINNKNFIVDHDTVRRGDSSELYLNHLPDEILIKMDYRSVYTIIDKHFKGIDPNVFKYKFYEALYYMFPENKNYWKGYMFYTSNNSNETIEDFLKEFVKNEHIDIDVIYDRIGHIFRSFIYKLDKGNIKLNQYKNLGEFYNNNTMVRFQHYDIEQSPIPYTIENNKVIFDIYGLVDNNILSSIVEISVRDIIFWDNEIINILTRRDLKYLIIHLGNATMLYKLFDGVFLYSDDLSELIPFVGNNKIRWEVLTNYIISHMHYIGERKLQNEKYKANLLYILNNDNVDVDKKSLDRSVNINLYPQEFILKFEYDIVYKLLQQKIFVNIDVLKYKVYEFLHRIFPRNIEYWKYISTTKFDKNELIPPPNKATYELDIENFSKQLLRGIKTKNYRDLLYKIIIFLTFNVTSYKGLNIRECYKNNKSIIDTVDISYIDSDYSIHSIIRRLNEPVPKKVIPKYLRYYDSDESIDSDDEF